MKKVTKILQYTPYNKNLRNLISQTCQTRKSWESQKSSSLFLQHVYIFPSYWGFIISFNFVPIQMEFPRFDGYVLFWQCDVTSVTINARAKTFDFHFRVLMEEAHVRNKTTTQHNHMREVRHCKARQDID